MQHTVPALFLMASLAAIAAAQDADAPIIDRIVVTSSPLQVLADEVVGSSDVVTADHIEENLSGSLADTISHEPGVTMTFFGPAASRPVIRGLGADRVRVLVNGIGMADASAASPDHAVSSEALEAERVEILRGPAAIAYGGGAIGGVVNIIDGRVPTRRPEAGIEGRIYIGSTSVDDGYQFATRTRFAVGDFVLHMEGLHRASEDYQIPGFAESSRQRALEELAHDGSVASADEAHEDDHAFGRVPSTDLEFSSGSIGTAYVGGWGYFGVAYKTSDGAYGLPGHAHEEDEHGALPAGIAFADATGGEEGSQLIMTQNRWDVRGDFDLGDGPVERARFSFGMGDYRHREIEDGAVGTVFTNDGWEGRLELRHRPIGDVEGAFGFQTFERDFAASGAEAYIVPARTADTGVFVVERFDAGDWGLEGGLRAETRTVETTRDSRSFQTASGSASVFFRPRQDVFIAVTGAMSERAPTDVELFAEGTHLATQSFEIGNANLSPERASSIDITGRIDGTNWSLDGAIFFVDYDGFIGQFPTGAERDDLPVFLYEQRDARMWGYEFRAERDLGSLYDWDLRSELIGEYVQGELVDGGHLPRIPPLSLTGLIEAERDFVSAKVEIIWTNDQDEFAAFELPTDGFTLVNAQLVFRPVRHEDVRLILEARNLTDAEARLHTSFLKDLLPLPGRNFRVALTAAF
jgi:iron complex outermembrane recepter protein